MQRIGANILSTGDGVGAGAGVMQVFSLPQKSKSPLEGKINGRENITAKVLHVRGRAAGRQIECAAVAAPG